MTNLIADYERAYAAATTPDHKLAVMANYGEIALSRLPKMQAQIDLLGSALRHYVSADDTRANGDDIKRLPAYQQALDALGNT